MKAVMFEQLLKRVGQLSPKQRSRLSEALRHAGCESEPVAYIERHFESAPRCPHCRHERVLRHGHANGLQRYRCRACGKTLNALTGTPLAKLRHKGKWLDFLQQMVSSQTVRQAARVSGVHRNTSFRWRHRFLAWVKNDRPSRLQGITEADETYFLESDKGARKLPRRARRRGGAASKRGISGEQVCVLITRDRAGRTLDFVTGKGPVSKAQLRQCLPPVLASDVLFVSDANASYRYFAQEAGISHESVNLSAGTGPGVRCLSRTSTRITAGCVNGLHDSTAWPPTTCPTISAGDVPSILAALLRPKPCCWLPSALFHSQR